MTIAAYATGSTNGIIFIRHGHDGPINALAFSPNGEFIASAGNDNTINIWSIKKGVKFSTLEWTQPSDSINKNVWSLDYSVDGTILSSASGDGRLRLWDAALVQKQTTRKAADFEPHLKSYQTTLYNSLSYIVNSSFSSPCY